MMVFIEGPMQARWHYLCGKVALHVGRSGHITTLHDTRMGQQNEKETVWMTSRSSDPIAEVRGSGTVVDRGTDDSFGEEAV